MKTLRTTWIAGAALMVASAGAGAQMRVAAQVPAGYLPPAGMCRVWFNGLAPDRQPAPTDCATARANLRTNSQIVYGQQGRVTRPGDPRGSYDPRVNGRDQDNWYNRAQANDGRYSRLSAKEQRKREKERAKEQRKREKEWQKHQRKAGHEHGDDERDGRENRGDDRGGNDRRATGRVRIP